MITVPMQLYVLGTGRRYSSLDTYAEEFSNASGFPRIMLRLSKNQITSKWGDGTEVVDGNLSMPFTDGWAWNIIRGAKTFRSIKKRLSEGYVHYTTFGLPVLSNPEKGIVTIHDLFFLDKEDESHGNIINLPEKFLRRFLEFRNLIAPSAWVRDQLTEYGFKAEPKVIYMPPPEEIRYLNQKAEARKLLHLPLDSKLVLSVSSSLRRKNVPVVRKTMEILGDHFKLVKVGSPVEGAINFSGLTPEEINIVYNACDVLLFPTLGEGYGKPVVEAFACGLPVVASNIPVMVEIAGDSAILVKPDPENCAKAVREAILNSDEYSRLGLLASKRFSREKFGKEVRSYYSAVTK